METVMPAVDRREQEPVARMKSALEFLREEAQRLNLFAVAHAIGRVLLVLRKQSLPSLELEAEVQADGESAEAAAQEPRKRFDA
jgi:hypothetical protein